MAQAQATLDRFMKMHPASPALDYALYLKGLASFRQPGAVWFLSRQELSERDQQAAKESFESFRELVNRFPDSKYAPDSRLRMTYTVNSLAARGTRCALLLHQARVCGGGEPCSGRSHGLLGRSSQRGSAFPALQILRSPGHEQPARRHQTGVDPQFPHIRLSQRHRTGNRERTMVETLVTLARSGLGING